jgi:hypothetical protein
VRKKWIMMVWIDGILMRTEECDTRAACFRALADVLQDDDECTYSWQMLPTTKKDEATSKSEISTVPVPSSGDDQTLVEKEAL